MVTPKQSEHYTGFVDIFFIIVLTLGAENSITLFSKPLSHEFALLMLSFVAIGLSWVFYHLSVDDLPYLGVGRSWIRFTFDSVIAFSYTFLILSVNDVARFGLFLAVIYFLYCVHGFSTVHEHGWMIRGSLRTTSVPMFWFIFGVYFLLISGYPCLLVPRLCLDWIPPSLTAPLSTIMYWVGVALSRYLRHGKYGNKTLRTLIWLHLQQRPVVAIDVDGVLADQVPHVLRRAEKELRVKMKKEDVTAWDTPVGGIPFDELIVKYLLDPNFVMTMPVMGGAVSAMEVVRKWAKIIVASSRPKETEDNSIQWLAQNFGLSRNQFKNTTSTGKSFLDADLLIDDNIGNVRSFVENGNHNLAILFSQPWNKQRDQLKELIEKKTIIVKEGWPEIEVLFRA